MIALTAPAQATPSAPPSHPDQTQRTELAFRAILELADLAFEALPNSTDADRCQAVLRAQAALCRLALNDPAATDSSQTVLQILELTDLASELLPNSTDYDRCQAILGGQAATCRLALDEVAPKEAA